jgi:hypothetical protein
VSRDPEEAVLRLLVALPQEAKEVQSQNKEKTSMHNQAPQKVKETASRLATSQLIAEQSSRRGASRRSQPVSYFTCPLACRLMLLI